MNQRGFALLAVVWTIAALAVLTGVGLMTARLGVSLSHNRILLARAEWAREACGEILLARLSGTSASGGPPSRLARLDTVDLGRGTWCHATVESPSTKLNLNLAGAADLRRLFGDDRFVTVLLTARPFASVDAVRSLPGWTLRMAEVLPLLTVRGDGRIDLNLAPPSVLRALPGLTEAMVDRLMQERAFGRMLSSPEEFPALLPDDLLQTFGPSYGAFLQAAATSPGTLVATLVGGARGRPPTARAIVTLALADHRVAVMRRETE